MQVLSINFDNSVDLSQFPVGQEVTVTKDDNSAQGIVLVQSSISDPEVPDHGHPANTQVGPPRPL